MFKTLLCIPPDYDCIFPTLGTPVLTAFLKQHGLAVSQIDLNLRYRDYLAKRITGAGLNIQARRFLLKPLLKKYYAENLQDRYYSIFLPRENDDVHATLPYDNNTNSSFYFTERLLSSPQLDRYLEDKEENTFYQFYKEEKLLDQLISEQINLLGISITSPSQAVAGFTLGRMIKKHLPHIHVVIGGQWATLYRSVLWQNKHFFDYFDSILAFEGETGLYQLAFCLENQGDISRVPNIIFKDQPFDPQAGGQEEDMNSLPYPDFDGLNLAEYDGNQHSQVCLTYETSRGCYWSKCAYCVDLPLPKISYRHKDPEVVVRDLKQLKQKYSTDYILLSDPGLAPRQMKEIAKIIIAADLKIKWWCMARLDEGFTSDIFQVARKAGLEKINFGFESANDRICRSLDKGNESKRSERIIKDCSAAGIEVDLQTILGLPGETMQDGLETIDFLLANRDHISRVTFNIYYLTPANFVYLYPEKYGIEFAHDPSLPFQFFIPFSNPRGMSKEEAVLLEKIYFSLLNKERSHKMPPSAKERYALAEKVSWRRAELQLNGKFTELHCLYNTRTDEYLYFDSQEKTICEEMLNASYHDYGNNPRQEKARALLAEAEGKGFMVKL